jgi:hypothetical protein
VNLRTKYGTVSRRFFEQRDITRPRRNHHLSLVEVTWIASVVDEGRAPNRCIRRGDTTERQCYVKAFEDHSYAEGDVDSAASQRG